MISPESFSLFKNIKIGLSEVGLQAEAHSRHKGIRFAITNLVITK
jgi:hypothetical protein